MTFKPYLAPIQVLQEDWQMVYPFFYWMAIPIRLHQGPSDDKYPVTTYYYSINLKNERGSLTGYVAIVR